VRRTRKRSTAAAGSPTRREDPKKQLTITSDLAVPPTLMTWERELLLPTVVSKVVDMIERASEPEGGGEP
jgi:hypothetical protein